MTTNRASESPFDRLGAQVLDDSRMVLWPLEGGARATIWAIAHQGLGEWRTWRAICDASGVTDPLDLEGAALLVPDDGAPSSAPFDFPGVPDGAPSVTVDLAGQDQLGVGPVVVSASPELLGLCVLRIQDVTEDSFRLALRGPSSDTFGPDVDLELARFQGITEAETSLVQLLLYSAEGQALSLRLSLDAFLAVWLARFWPLSLSADLTSARAALLLPPDDESGLGVQL